MLKVVILTMCFEGDITFVIGELKVKSIVKGIYRLLSRFTGDQFVDMVLRTVNTVCGKWKSGKTIIIGYKLVLAIEYHSLKPLAFRFTLSSVTKITSLGVVLIGIAFSLGFRDKGSLQRLAGW